MQQQVTPLSRVITGLSVELEVGAIGSEVTTRAPEEGIDFAESLFQGVVFTILFGVLLWMMIRANGDTTVEESPGSQEQTEDAPPREADASGSDPGPLDRVNEYVEEGNKIRTKADDHLDTGRYDQAIKTYGRAREAYQEALAVAQENDFIDDAGIRRHIEQINDGVKNVRQQKISRTLSEIGDGVEHAESLVADREYERARDELEELHEEAATAAAEADERGFDDLWKEASALQEELESNLEAVTQRIEATPGPPNQVPRAPDIPIEYDAITKGDRIGRGGDADVFEATVDTPDGHTTIAVKEPRFSGTLHGDVVDRFLDEAETWDRLDGHDNIVGVIDWGSNPIPWIGLEYMDGGHLGERTGTMKVDQATWTALGIVEGVLYAHDRGITHLDIKPENILFRETENGCWDVAKVGDWGLAKLLIEHSKSMEGLTPQYSAPEQFDTDEYGAVDKRTDIYQLGAVLYELYTGQPVFTGQPAQIMHKVTSESPEPPTEVNPDLPEQLDDILMCALEKRKVDRYERVPYLRDELRDLYDSL